jgi:asparagine synthetase A
MVFAPVNCPSDEARRADELAAGLSRMGIAVQRSSHFSTETSNPNAEQQAQLQRTVAVLNGGIPAVFFNGMGKANPTLDEVVAQVRAPR